MTVVDLYTIQILHDDLGDAAMPWQVTAALLMDAEENLTDLLPPGYRARIRRWDHADPDEGENDE